MPLSLACLALLGAADMVSVYVRQSLIQLYTPDAMRGRVGAVSTLSISASNELGEAKSGFLAALLGPVGAVVAGGVGAIGVTLSGRMVPELVRPNFEPAEPSPRTRDRPRRLTLATRPAHGADRKEHRMKADNILDTIGNTPHVRVNRLFGDNRGLDQVRARQPRRLDQGPHRAVDDRGRRGVAASSKPGGTIIEPTWAIPASASPWSPRSRATS